MVELLTGGDACRSVSRTVSTQITLTLQILLLGLIELQHIKINNDDDGVDDHCLNNDNVHNDDRSDGYGDAFMSVPT